MAWDRQNERCAKCGNQLNIMFKDNLENKKGWKLILRTSREDGGKKTGDNTILLCSICYNKIEPK
jgi:hypothetical protein